MSLNIQAANWNIGDCATHLQSGEFIKIVTHGTQGCLFQRYNAQTHRYDRDAFHILYENLNKFFIKQSCLTEVSHEE